MASKDFSRMNTGRVSAALEQATGKKRQQGKASPEEAAERAENLKTQGRKGCALPRINMAFSPDNYDFIKTVARINGMTMTEYLNTVVTEYRQDHGEIYAAAKALIAQATGGNADA